MERPYVPANEHAPGPRGGAQANGDCPNEARIGKIEARLDDFGKRLDEVGTSLTDFGQRLDSSRQIETAPTSDNVSRETVDADRVEFLAKRINALEARIVTLENRPHISEETINSLNDALHAKMQSIIEKQVNKALGDLRSRVVTIEKSSNSVTTTKNDPDSAKLGRIAEIVQSLGGYVREIETTVEHKHTELEQRYAELAEHITDNNLQTMKLNTRLYRALAALEHDDEGKDAA
jgi:uncharacterized coiled-coil protein SlyX